MNYADERREEAAQVQRGLLLVGQLLRDVDDRWIAQPEDAPENEGMGSAADDLDKLTTEQLLELSKALRLLANIAGPMLVGALDAIAKRNPRLAAGEALAALQTQVATLEFMKERTGGGA